MSFAFGTMSVASSRKEPVLHNGDRLTRLEFERRYVAMPEGTWAELVEGVVYSKGKVSFWGHAAPHAMLDGWVGYYMSKTSRRLRVASHASLRLDGDNEPHPDVVMFLPEDVGGRAKVDDDDFVSGAPELVCEVAASSVSIDLHAKMNAYRRNGVKEYLVWRTEDAAIDWYVLRDGRYEATAGEDGLLKSGVFPGLWLDAAAMLTGDLGRVIAGVEAGVGTSEHGAFVAKLR